MIIRTLLLVSLFGTQFALATESNGVIVEDKEHKFEVKVDKKSGRVEVFALESKSKPPRSMSLSIFRDDSTGETIELRAINASATNPGAPQFQGSLAPFAGSSMGIELQFNLNKKTWKRLRGQLP